LRHGPACCYGWNGWVADDRVALTGWHCLRRQPGVRRHGRRLAASGIRARPAPQHFQLARSHACARW
jgi:hypothetical protein